MIHFERINLVFCWDFLSCPKQHVIFLDAKVLSMNLLVGIYAYVGSPKLK